MYFTDDWELEGEDEWDELYDAPKCEPDKDTVQHRRKYHHVEDGFNKR